mmetsp:Transcript_24317/g.47737  ORF Transcript_24317/g.47737 Transcript_24317/m.47737 type:complete len:134 (-) Transcript_24317:82-483(-)
MKQALPPLLPSPPRSMHEGSRLSSFLRSRMSCSCFPSLFVPFFLFSHRPRILSPFTTRKTDKGGRERERTKMTRKGVKECPTHKELHSGTTSETKQDGEKTRSSINPPALSTCLPEDRPEGKISSEKKKCLLV